MRNLLLVVVLAVSSFSIAHADGKTPAKADKSLYDRLGGKTAITAVVHDFVAAVAADKRINSFFAKSTPASLKKLEANLVDQISAATGCTTCKYTGKDMKTAHAGMNIKEADFNALVEDLVKTLDKYKVPEKEKGELLTPLAAMKGDIVTAK
jgi:hemoglobin